MTATAESRSGLLVAVPVVAVATLILDAAVGFLPGDPLVWLLTARRLVILVGLAALVVLGARMRQFRTPLDLPIALLVLSGLLTTVAGGHEWSAVRGLVTLVAFYYLCTGLLRVDPPSEPALAAVALVAVVIAGTVALAQIEAGVNTGFCRTPSLGDVDCGRAGALIRATGTFANPNLLAAAVVLLAPIGALALSGVTTRSARTVQLLLVALAYVGSLFTYSRGGYVAAAAGAIVLGLLPFARGRRRRLVMIPAIVLVGLWLALASAIFYFSGASVLVRDEVWGAALGSAFAHPLAGVGLTRGGAVVSERIPGEREFAHAHNLWLNWFLEAGVLGLLAILLLTGMALWIALRGARAGSATAGGGLAALVGFFLLSVADHPTNNSRLAMLLWFVLALVATATPATPPAEDPLAE